MDINEVSDRQIKRHPWELSRTRCVIGDVIPYMQRCMVSKDYINIGSGDMYFDGRLLAKLPGYTAHAVDIGYKETDAKRFIPDKGHTYTYNSLDDVPASVVADCAFLMDSLEYIDDEPAFLARVAGHVRQGGYIFFTLPAFRKLFSQHDVIVRLLRRYDKRDFVDIVSRTQGLSIAGMHYFYTPLLLIRFIQKTFHLEIDPEHKVTTGWRYGDRHIITRCAE